MAEATVRDVLSAKGTDVAWVTPSASVADVTDALAYHGVGALVVSPDGRSIEGMVSERDVVRGLAHRGDAVLADQAQSIMTREVVTCALDDKLSMLMARMTEGRFRHLPVVVDDELAGIISIGDVVKQRLGELQAEAEQLLEFIQAR